MYVIENELVNKYTNKNHLYQLDGLKLAWQFGYKRIWLESDFVKALALVEHGCSRDNPNYHLVATIEELLAMDWTVC